MKKTIILSALLMLGSLVSVNAQTGQKKESKKETPAVESTKLNHNTTRASKGRVSEDVDNGKAEGKKVKAEGKSKAKQGKKNVPSKSKIKPAAKKIAPPSKGVNNYTPLIRNNKKGRKVSQIK